MKKTSSRKSRDRLPLMHPNQFHYVDDCELLTRQMPPQSRTLNPSQVKESIIIIIWSVCLYQLMEDGVINQPINRL